VPTVTLHIGASKTGTSFIQTVLMNSRSTLRDLGVLWPGDSWRDVVKAVHGLRGVGGCSYDRWSELVDEIDRWEGDALLSMEFLSMAKPEAVERAVESLSGHRVRIVLTMRDLGRTVPAQWQETVQTGSSWTYAEYLAGLTDRKPRSTEAGQHFWRKHDYVRILSTWREHISNDDVLLVTVPPQGSASHLLWERFCAAAGLPPDRFDATIRVNESLGAHSAEVMRHVMACAAVAGVEKPTRRVMKEVLAKGILSSRKPEEPTLVLPDRYQEWTIERGRRMINQLTELGPVVIGDLEDLVPQFRKSSSPTTADPSAASADELLTAAATGLVGLSTEVARRGLDTARQELD
jgi:hypothetical protein